jgi:hypothetical protein
LLLMRTIANAAEHPFILDVTIPPSLLARADEVIE